MRTAAEPIPRGLKAALLELAVRSAKAAPALAFPLVLTALRATGPETYSLNGSKLLTLLAPTVTMTASDTPALVILFCLVALALIRGLVVAPASRLALVGFGLAAWLAPSAHGAANLIDARLVVFWWYFAAASVSLKQPEGLRPLAAAVAVALVIGRLSAIEPAWRQFEDLSVSVREQLAALPEGARALIVRPPGCEDPDIGHLGALSAFALTDRRAYANTIFAQSGLQPIASADPALDGAPTITMDERWLTREGRATLDPRLTKAPWAGAFVDWRRHFTHVVDIHGRCRSTIADLGLHRLGGGPALDVYEAR
jgi:hypothetical protein